MYRRVAFVCVDCGRPTERKRHNDDARVCLECGIKRADAWATRERDERLARRAAEQERRLAARPPRSAKEVKPPPAKRARRWPPPGAHFIAEGATVWEALGIESPKRST